MPTIFKRHGFRFLFYSNEGFEPCHAHVIGQGGEAKFWIPSCRLAWSYNLNANQLKQILGIIKENKQMFEEKWDEYFHRRTN
ncbi:MAG: hypothetical protein AUJ60_07615 [Nitrospirae bacterium CG1_02_44_142]|nr:MAG: hypothetical protein AUJ60_07615 [Nitrospirae bacterium CG1_02_44_142]